MQRIIFTLTATAVLTVGNIAMALPIAGGGDVAPKPLLTRPPATKTAAPLPDTTALLPAGKYTLSLTLKQKTLTGPAELTRSGGAVTATLSPNETLTGTLDASGRLQLAGGSGADSLRLTAATVQNHRAAGPVQAGVGATQLTGSFTLDPVTGARKPMAIWPTDGASPAAPAAPAGCGFWCGFKRWLGL